MEVDWPSRQSDETWQCSVALTFRVQVLTLRRSLAASLLWISLRGFVRCASFRSKEALSKHQLRQLILMMAIITLVFF